MSRIIRFGDFEVDLAAGQLRRHGLRIGLRDKSFQILGSLLEQPGEVVTREHLQRRLWPSDVFVDFENNLNTAVARLREALGDSAERPRFIETLPKRGYRFIAKVSEPPGAGAQVPAAYNEHLQGLFLMGRGTLDAFEKARRHLERAIARDPEFAAAYDALAELYWYSGYAGFVSPREAFSRGIVYARRAIEIDETRGETHALLGQFHKTVEYNWTEVEREMALALRLAPRSPVVRVRYALSELMPHGRLEEAVAELDRALELDPLSFLARFWLGIMLMLWRRYDRAIEEQHKLLELDPSHWGAHFVMHACYRYQGMLDEAVAAQRRAVDLSGESAHNLGWLGLSLAEAGQPAEAREVLRRLHSKAANGYVPPTSFAWVHLGLGETDAAFSWLDRAVDECDQRMMPIKSYRFFDPIRADPRFLDLLRKMHLDD